MLAGSAESPVRHVVVMTTWLRIYHVVSFVHSSSSSSSSDVYPSHSPTQLTSLYHSFHPRPFLWSDTFPYRVCVYILYIHPTYPLLRHLFVRLWSLLDTRGSQPRLDVCWSLPALAGHLGVSSNTTVVSFSIRQQPLWSQATQTQTRW